LNCEGEKAVKFDLNNPRTLATTGIMAALILAMTLIHIATTGTGYVHLGDIAVYFASFAFGPWVGLVAGGLGTALADVVSGYATFAPLTLIVHGLQGFVAGVIAGKKPSYGRLALAVLAGAAVVIAGYFAGEYLVPVLGGPGQAVGEVIPNVIQQAFGALGAVIYVLVLRAYPRLRRDE
jgi:uncharacterized membrane protein